MKRQIELGLLLMGSACAPGFSAAGDPRNPQAADSVVRLNVTNHYNGPMEIYAVGSGTVYRMGTVLPGFVGHFVLRQAMVASAVEFVAQLSSRDVPIRSDRLLLAPGKVVDFEIATNLMSSTATVRP
jgi:hypothetical protein